MGLIEDQFSSCKPLIPPSFCHVHAASSVVNSCRFQYNLKKSELPSSRIICAGMSWLPVPLPLVPLPVNANAAYTFASDCLYPPGLEYTSSAVRSLVGTRSSFFVQAA